MLTQEQTTQFGDIFEEFGKSLDITEAQYKTSVGSYEAVGKWLADEKSPLAPYKPEIRPQGSFMLETMTRSVNDTDELDIDLVCQLTGKDPAWTQYDVKKKVGDRIKAHDTYKVMLKKEEGRRCWTLDYEDYHMDILPSIISKDYQLIIAKSYMAESREPVENLAIRITDKNEDNFFTATSPDDWLKSNPFGYARWFLNSADTGLRKSGWLLESVQSVPKYSKDKFPLQRVVQILKRHRDIIFNGDEDKPISMIITTLAAKAYGKENNILEALLNVVRQMPNQIEERYSYKHNRLIKWIGNPVNDEENFADKWPDHPERERKYYEWLNKIKETIGNAIEQRGLQKIQESLEEPFGKKFVLKSFSNYGEHLRRLRESGSLKMAAGTGILGNVGTTVKKHDFHGN